MSLKHNFPFDPTYGYSLEKLMQVVAPSEPADFVQFWRDTYRELMQVSLRLTSREVASPNPNIQLLEVNYDSLDGARIGAWVTRPRAGRISRGVVSGHGYGGRAEPDMMIPGSPAAAIFPCARGFHRSANVRFPNNAAEHVVHGIENRNTYIHRGCVADYWAAATALIELFPETADQIHYMGCSFGGGIGALMLPWDNRIKKAYLDVPSFGNHPLRLQAPCVGSGEAVRQYYQKHPEVVDVLKYFDSACAARHIRIPVLVSPAEFDPAVPPQGQFSVYNSIPASHRKLFVRKAAHFEYSGGPAENAAMKLDEWFA